MEIVGDERFYLVFDLKRLFRDVQAARHHPLPESDQAKFPAEHQVASDRCAVASDLPLDS